jgi:RNA 2',3'-cyclic 3'-phosphodiesterase
MEKLRTFIAIDLNSEVRARLTKVQQLLEKSGADIRWVKPERAHLTLKFLGDTTPDQVEEIGGTLKSIASAAGDFEVVFGSMGVFGPKKRPRVLWVGVQKGLEQLRGLQKAVDRKLKKSGFTPETKEYSPHLTLGRFRSNKNAGTLLEFMEKHPQKDCGRLNACAVHLIKSTLTPSGPVYEKLITARLQT